MRFKQPYRSSPCGNRPCGRPAQQENEFSPLQFLELHLLAMVSQWGVCNNLDFSIPLTPRRLRVRHSGAFCINGIAQRPSLDANTGKNSGARQIRVSFVNYNSDEQRAEPLCLAKAALFAKAREAARFPGGLGTCSSSTLGGDFSGDHFYA